MLIKQRFRGKTSSLLFLCDFVFTLGRLRNETSPMLMQWGSMMMDQHILDLTDYDFANDGFVGASFDDDDNKRKLAYRHRIIAHKYKKVISSLIWLIIYMIIEAIWLPLCLQNTDRIDSITQEQILNCFNQIMVFLMWKFRYGNDQFRAFWRVLKKLYFF